jgi:hypothetical protein
MDEIDGGEMGRERPRDPHFSRSGVRVSKGSEKIAKTSPAVASKEMRSLRMDN